jgi:hypothetical protein
MPIIPPEPGTANKATFYCGVLADAVNVSVR